MTTPVRITYALAKEAMERAVAEKGEDYIVNAYSGNQPRSRAAGGICRYSDPYDARKPSCLVGNVFWQWGLLAEAHEHESTNAAEVLRHLSTPSTNSASSLLYWAQVRQDDGLTWGEALAYALDFVPNDDDE